MAGGKLGVVVKHGRGEQDVEQEIGYAGQIFANRHPTYFPELLNLPCSISLSHTIGYNARVELSPSLKEKAPLNI